MAKRRASRPKSPTQATRDRRQRLMNAIQGRRLEDAYLDHPEIREDFEAEARSGEPDAIVTPEMADLLKELIAHKRQVVPAPSVSAPAKGKAAKHPPGFSAAETRVEPAAGGLGDEVCRALAEPTTAAAHGTLGMAATPAAAPTGIRGIEIFAPAKTFFSTDQVVIVPGFLASSLSDTTFLGHGLIWVNPLLGLHNDIGELQLGPYDRLERDLDPKVKIAASGALPIIYDLLRLDLEVRRYTVDVFPVDWRKDIEIAAGALAARLRNLAGQGRPMHVIAHSQGALVARRALQILGPTAVKSFLRHLVLLGPANFGTFSAVSAVAGQHSLLPLVKRLIGTPPQGFQPVLGSLSGAYQLLPFDPVRVPWLAKNDITKTSFWKSGIDAARLKQFFAWAKGVDTSFIDDRTSVILGDNHGDPTVGGVTFDGNGQLVVDESFNLAGDGTVPHSCSVLPGVQGRTYIASGTEHSMLPTFSNVIAAVRDILAGRGPSLTLTSSNPADHVAHRPSGVAFGLAVPARGLAPKAPKATKTKTPKAKAASKRRKGD